MRVCIVVGTRPEIVKMASVIKQLEADGSDFTIIHSGQHYDQNMSEVFFKELDLPVPDTNLEIGSGSPMRQMARALTGLDKSFRGVDPDTVLVEGDTNTVLAFALATAHRAENVDDPRILREIFKILVGCPLLVVFPIHPRTRSRFRSAGLLRKLESSENIILLPPVGYIDFLWLMIHCQFIITD